MFDQVAATVGEQLAGIGRHLMKIELIG